MMKTVIVNNTFTDRPPFNETIRFVKYSYKLFPGFKIIIKDVSLAVYSVYSYIPH